MPTETVVALAGGVVFIGQQALGGGGCLGVRVGFLCCRPVWLLVVCLGSYYQDCTSIGIGISLPPCSDGNGISIGNGGSGNKSPPPGSPGNGGNAPSPNSPDSPGNSGNPANSGIAGKSPANGDSGGVSIGSGARGDASIGSGDNENG